MEAYKIAFPIATGKVKEVLTFYHSLGYESITDFELHLPGTKISLKIYPTDDEPNEVMRTYHPNDYFFLALKIDNIDSFKESLNNSSLTVDTAHEIPIGEYIYLKDPDGRRICVYELFV